MKKKALSLILFLFAFTFLFAATPALSTQAAMPKISKTSISLTVGKTKKLAVKNAPCAIKWKSTKVKVATVNNRGKVTAKKAGKTVVTATIGNYKLKCNVTVKNKTAKKSSKSSGNMVWIPNTGSKYHRTSSCSGMRSPSHVTLKEAKEMGYTPCSRCY